MDASSLEAGFAALGAGIAVIGAGLGVGLIGFAAMQSMARQPELTPKITSNMLIIAALIEGVALFALVLCFMAMNK